MPWGIAAAGVISAGAGLAGSAMQADAAENAGNAELQAAQAAAQENRRQFDITRRDFAPFRQQGVNALTQLSRELGLAAPANGPGGIPAIGYAGTPGTLADFRAFAADNGSGDLPSIVAEYMSRSGGKGDLAGLRDFIASAPGLNQQGDFLRTIDQYSAQYPGLGPQVNGPASVQGFQSFLGNSSPLNALVQDYTSRGGDTSLSGLRNFVSSAGPGLSSKGDFLNQLDAYEQAAAAQPAAAPAGGGTVPGSGFTATPGYQFRLNEGLKAAQHSAAARGMLGSGATLKALNNYAQGVASDEYGNYVNRLAALAGVGQTATSGTAAAGQAATAGTTNALLAGGNARASSYIGQGNAAAAGAAGIGNAANGAISNYLLMQAINRPRA